MTFSNESTSAVVLKFSDLFSANESKLALDGVGCLAMAAIRLLLIPKFMWKMISFCVKFCTKIIIK